MERSKDNISKLRTAIREVAGEMDMDTDITEKILRGKSEKELWTTFMQLKEQRLMRENIRLTNLLMK